MIAVEVTAENYLYIFYIFIFHLDMIIYFNKTQLKSSSLRVILCSANESGGEVPKEAGVPLESSGGPSGPVPFAPETQRRGE